MLVGMIFDLHFDLNYFSHGLTLVIAKCFSVSDCP